MNNIGFIVWGIRNGFKNNWLSSNVSANVYQHFTDDMRQICGSTIDKFFSIEKLNGYTILTIYNPNMKDHVQRKAYIALSLVVEDGYNLNGDVINTLELMMNEYEQKQGNAMVNMISADQITVHASNLSLVKDPKSFTHNRIKKGALLNSSKEYFKQYFNIPFIFKYNKVYFSTESITSLERDSSIEKISGFENPIFLKVSDFNEDLHKLTINGQEHKGTKFLIKKGDLIQFIDRKEKRGKEFNADSSDIQVSMSQLFPPIYRVPKKRKKISPFVIFLGILIIVGGAYYFYPSEVDTVTTSNGEEAKLLSAEYDFNQDLLIFKNLSDQLDSSYFLGKKNEIKDTSLKTFQLDTLESVLIKNLRTDSLNIELHIADTVLYIGSKINDVDSLTPFQVKIPELTDLRIVKKKDDRNDEYWKKISSRLSLDMNDLKKWNEGNDNDTLILIKPLTESSSGGRMLGESFHK